MDALLAAAAHHGPAIIFTMASLYLLCSVITIVGRR